MFFFVHGRWIVDFSDRRWRLHAYRFFSFFVTMLGCLDLPCEYVKVIPCKILGSVHSFG